MSHKSLDPLAQVLFFHHDHYLHKLIIFAKPGYNYISIDKTKKTKTKIFISG